MQFAVFGMRSGDGGVNQKFYCTVSANSYSDAIKKAADIYKAKGQKIYNVEAKTL